MSIIDWLRGRKKEGTKEYNRELIAAVTRAVRRADEGFQKSGGSSRHWVIEQFLPCLEDEGLIIVHKEKPPCQP